MECSISIIYFYSNIICKKWSTQLEILIQANEFVQYIEFIISICTGTNKDDGVILLWGLDMC
jgi:hypothetical protein